MCNQENENRGGSIQPKARPSIHAHASCPFTAPQVDMVRYGLNDTKPSGSRASQSPQGHDEVDNVQSKHALPISSPKAFKRGCRRNSFNDVDQLQTDDSEFSNVHAKSLPADFLSLSSENEYSWTTPNLSNSSERRLAFNRSGNHSHDSINSSNSRERNHSESISDDQEDSQNRQENNSANSSVLFSIPIIIIRLSAWGIIIIMGAWGIALYNGTTTNNIFIEMFNSDSSSQNLQFRFNHDLHHIGEQYNIKDDSILQLQKGISKIMERHDTGSFVFTYNSNRVDTNEIENFIERVANTASRYLRDKSVQHVVVDGTKLAMRTHSELINKYRETVTSNGVLLVKNLDEVPSALAMAFHYYCDEYNPLIKKSAIIFTLDMKKCSQNPVEQKPTHTNIENCLKKKWTGVPEDNLPALLGRVVNTVIDVTG